MRLKEGKGRSSKDSKACWAPKSGLAGGGGGGAGGRVTAEGQEAPRPRERLVMSAEAEGGAEQPSATDRVT